MTQETMQFDVLIVGAGPAGLATAIRLKQLAAADNKDISVAILEKAAEIGAHTLSGAVIDPKSLTELIPDWQTLGAPLTVPVTKDVCYWLTAHRAFSVPVLGPLHNKGNYVVRLNQLVRWLGDYAISLGIDIFPGFAAADVIYDDNHRVIGIKTGEFGRDQHGEPTAQFQPSMPIFAKQVVLAEGCRGSLSQQLIKDFNLASQHSPQTYGLGIKELWEVDRSKHQKGLVMHTVGWPLPHMTYGGGFIYHTDKHQVMLGLVVGLDYDNPYLDLFQEMQRWKTHPLIRALLTGGKRVGYGARAVNEGGWQALPQLAFPGGVLVGDAAGFLNVPRIKGTHTAMKSGMLAAEAIWPALCQPTQALLDYRPAVETSWLGTELKRVRNIRPAFHAGLALGLGYAALDYFVLRGKAPWTFKHHVDHLSLKPKAAATPIHYPKPDGQLTFDRTSSVYLSNTYHEANQPCHLQLKDKSVPTNVNYAWYDAPETRYCPAGVYEIIANKQGVRLHINAQNCVHCKTCDIKDPTQNIHWVPPEGGGGPNYRDM